MIALGIETATMLGGVAIVGERQGLMYETRMGVSRGHSERVMPEIARALEACGLVLDDVGAIAVSVGPGSFTGLRIGLATAQGLAFGREVRLVGVPTLEALAYPLLPSERLVAPMFDARRGEVYGAAFGPDREGGYGRIVPECSMPARDFARLLKGRGRVILVGDGATLYREAMVIELGTDAVFAPAYLGVPSASAVATLGLERTLGGGPGGPASGLGPMYVRRSEAEVRLDLTRKR